jgi:hypothetical protein
MKVKYMLQGLMVRCSLAQILWVIDLLSSQVKGHVLRVEELYEYQTLLVVEEGY